MNNPMTSTEKRLEFREKLREIMIWIKVQPHEDYTDAIAELFDTSIQEAIAEERKRVRGEIESVKTNIAWQRTTGIEADSGDDARQIGWDGACDLLLSSLDKPKAIKLKENK